LYHNNYRNNRKAIQNIRAIIVLIFYIHIYFCLMETKFFLIHLIDISLWRILVSDDVGDLEKTQIEDDLSFPPLDVSSLEVKGLVEISNNPIWLLVYAPSSMWWFFLKLLVQTQY